MSLNNEQSNIQNVSFLFNLKQNNKQLKYTGKCFVPKSRLFKDSKNSFSEKPIKIIENLDYEKVLEPKYNKYHYQFSLNNIYFGNNKNSVTAKNCNSSRDYGNSTPTLKESNKTNFKFYSPDSHTNTQADDEYADLYYKSQPTNYSQNLITENEVQEHDLDDSTSNSSINQLNSSFNSTVNNKQKLSDDFKTKYKTEVCRFWEINRSCKFGDNVRI